MELFVLIMAGGVGSRFWPRSRKSKPKQLLNIFGQNSMIRETYRRVSNLVPPGNVYVITNKVQAQLITAELPELPKRNIIAEPVGKNTAPCVAVSAKTILNRSEESVIITLPADHLIENEKEFEKKLLEAAKFAYQSKGLVTFGITPTRPETGYGYIHFNKNSSENIFKVKEFVEKPNLETAKKYLIAGDYLWNSGMFIWRSDVILDEIKKYLPEVYSLVAKINDTDYDNIIEEIYPKFKSVSIDYGIMEKSEMVYVMEGEIGWSDVGSWESVYELSKKDENGNALIGDVFTIDTKNSYVYSENNFTALVGVHDLVVINLGDSLLVCDRAKAQAVKNVVDELTKNDRNDLL
ncbi:MAG: mannose-1-phosphate guanylyltransferase [Melioribacteraceae bacterium]|nr:MAG: mannose-1-phosphate guanylyltransferase [Melioribacteraceae bacterium]